MRNVAIVEDEKPAADLLVSFLAKYTEKYGEEFNVHRFVDGISFLTNYRPHYDLVFMDIELPDINGLNAAKKMREMDREVTLVFVTNMAQFAVRGYEVSAYDYIVKPLTFPNFVLKLQRALEYIKSKSSVKVYVPVDDGVMCLDSCEIKYIEIVQHRITYHTVLGEYLSHGTLKKVEALLAGAPFVRCNSCYLVNLRFVTAVKDFKLFLGAETLQISHPRRSEFLRKLNDYLGGSV